MPEFDEDRFLLALDVGSGIERLAAADFNGDRWPDLIVVRMIFQTLTEHEISILINDRQGGLVDGTHAVFDGPIPKVQHPARILMNDFNGDGHIDIFIPDLGMDADPFPGYQNTLVLSAPGGKLIDATAKLPQQRDTPHSAAEADIDGDGDVDLYIGNLGGNGIPPQIWLNDGTGTFTVAEDGLPAQQVDLALNWYTASLFADVDADGAPDLILGQGNPNRPSHVLLNDGHGRFSEHKTPLPPAPFAPNQQPIDIQAADINDDGYLDLFLADTRSAYYGRVIQVLVNNGDGTLFEYPFPYKKISRICEWSHNHPYPGDLLIVTAPENGPDLWAY